MSELDSDYAGAGFDGQLRAGETAALLVIDVCRAYLDHESHLYAGVEDAFAANVRLVAAARAAGVPVIFTRVVYEGDGADGGLFFRKVPALRAFMKDSPLGDFDDRLRPAEGDMVITKQYPSAFFSTHLAATLTARRIDTLLITGFSTSGCVRASALDALQHGFVPLVIREACGDRHAAPHEANLFDIQAKCGEVIDEAAAMVIIGAQTQKG